VVEVDWFTAFLFARHCVSNHLFVLHTPSPLQLHRRHVKLLHSHHHLHLARPEVAFLIMNDVARIMLARTPVEKVQIVVVLVTHRIAITKGAIVVTRIIAINKDVQPRVQRQRSHRQTLAGVSDGAACDCEPAKV